MQIVCFQALHPVYGKDLVCRVLQFKPSIWGGSPNLLGNEDLIHLKGERFNVKAAEQLQG